MRPLKLIINAFGPYANTQVFDFQLLGERNLFLITGDIGAGKTTIFDAICCTLYGETSGGERTVEEMRSHHALAETETEITLEFSIQGDLFRAWFSPKQKVPKKKGEGFTEKTIQSALYQIDFVEQASEEATLLCESISKTKPQIEALIGFNVNQFRQVMMLAQGKFRELLNANSTDREAILKSLVDTEFLSRFERQLKNMEISLKKKVLDLESQIKGLLKSESIDNADVLPPQLEEIKQQCLLADKEINAAELIRSQAEITLNQAVELNKLFKQQQDLLIEQQSMTEQKDGIDSLKISLTNHTEAEKHWSDFRLFEEANKAFLASNTALDKAQKKHDTLTKKASQTAETLSQQEKQKPVQEQRKIELQSLIQINKSLATLTMDKQKQQHAITTFNTAQQTIMLAEKTRQDESRQLEKIEVELATLNQIDADLVETKHQLDHHKKLLKRLNRIEEKQKAQQISEQKVSGYQEQLTQQSTQYQSLKETLQELEQAQQQELASHLANQLEEDKPCTVCGSHEHPIPAIVPAHVPTNMQIESAKKACLEQENTLAVLKEKAEQQKIDLAGINGILDELLNASPKIEHSLATCKAEISTLKKQSKVITLQVEQKKYLSQQQGSLKNTLKKANDEINQQRVQFNEKQSLVNILDGQVNSQLKIIPSQYQGKKDLKPEIIQLELQIEEFKQRLEALTIANQIAEQSLNEALGTFNSAKTQQEKTINDLTGKETTINHAIASSIFTDINALKKARLPEHEVQYKKEKIDFFSKQSQRIEIQLNKLNTQLLNKTNPDIAPLQSAYKQAQFNKGELLKQKGSLDERFNIINTLIKKVAKEKDKLKATIEEYQQTSHLASIANGSGYQGSKLSFSRYLLGRLLDEILQAASSRLDVMSEGRYQLTRKLDQSNKKIAFGLDIELTDAYTGKKRSVNTFSGGEGFLASLSLALGLSEVVQNNAGGIQLDTLFVDEGFGSLNDEALEQAINVLTALSGDGRLVGVISHVAELKERIDTQLVVSKTAYGSSAEFVL